MVRWGFDDWCDVDIYGRCSWGVWDGAALPIFVCTLDLEMRVGVLVARRFALSLAVGRCLGHCCSPSRGSNYHNPLLWCLGALLDEHVPAVSYLCKAAGPLSIPNANLREESHVSGVVLSRSRNHSRLVTLFISPSFPTCPCLTPTTHLF